jgi:tRNA threonylcarbamoyladenosine biosynthesis protein TsaE
MSASLVSREWLLLDDTHTRSAGEVLAHALSSLPKDKPLLVTLQGELGAGKTTLVGGLLQGLGHVGRVPSPTYTLIESYDLADRVVAHLDLYRLTDPQQLEDLGWRDLLQPNAIVLVEWPERAGALLSVPDLSIRLGYGQDGMGRQLELGSSSETFCRLIDRISF